jgi:hypothetical protein
VAARISLQEVVNSQEQVEVMPWVQAVVS